MAFGLKYTHTFFQLKNYQKDVPSTLNPHQWRIEIYEEGYVGADSTFDCDKNSIVLGRDGKLLDVVQGTKLSFTVVNQTEGQFKEFRTADWGQYKILLIKDPDGTPQTKFIGYNQSEIYTESFDQPPYTTRFEATCGLNHLKHVKWSNEKVQENDLDANSTSTISASLALPSELSYIQITVDGKTGTHDNHVVVLQFSSTGVSWGDSSYEITGTGTFLAQNLPVGINYYRLKIKTAEGSVSTINWSTEILYYGQKSLIELTRLALNKLPSPLPIREFVNIYEDSINSATTDSMLNQIFVASSAYKKKSDEGEEALEEAFSCNKALEEALKVFGVNIYQANGYWYIVRVQEYMDTTIYYRDFNANVGTEDVITVDGTGSFTTNTKTITGPNGLDGELVLVAPSAELSIEPPLNRVQIEYNQTNLDQVSSDFIKNGDFLSYLDSGSFQNVLFWDFVGVDPLTYNSLIGLPSARWFRFDPITQQNAFAVGSVYMEQFKYGIPVSILDSVVLSFDLKYSSYFGTTNVNMTHWQLEDWVEGSLIISVEIEVQLGTYYLHGDNISGYTWVNSYGRATFNRYHTGAIGYNDPHPNYYAQAWGDSIYNVSISIPTFPETNVVDFRFRVYQPYSNLYPYVQTLNVGTLTTQTIDISNISFVYLPDEAPPEEQLILYSTINDDENLEKIEVLHGDGSNSGTLNSFRNDSGTITNEWNRRGLSDDSNILSLFLNQLGDLRGDFVKELSCTIIGELDVFNTIEHTTDVVTEYYIKTYEWNICTSEYSFTLSELENSILPVIIQLERSINNVDTELPSERVAQIGKITSSTSDGSIVTNSYAISPNQSDLNNYI